MSKKNNEIADNEIRIITGSERREPKRVNKRKRILWVVIALAVVVELLVITVIITHRDSDEDEEIVEVIETCYSPPVKEAVPAAAATGRVSVVDTTINGDGLQIIYPEGLRPELVIGMDNLNDPTIMLATQAADVRRDNGSIAGMFIMNGEVVSTGEAKAGFCSIINNELSIGISDATPVLEQALTEKGYFFRQYPLVVGGQIVENKPKNKAKRKALAELDGRMCVIVSKSRLTFHDFSQLLIDVGVRNAIYLVGSSSYGFYVTDSGERVLMGMMPETVAENINFIVWKDR